MAVVSDQAVSPAMGFLQPAHGGRSWSVTSITLERVRMEWSRSRPLCPIAGTRFVGQLALSCWSFSVRGS